MGNLIVRQSDLGFNAHIRDAAELPPGSAADGSQNVLYSRGTIKTPFGFDKVQSGSLPLAGAPVLGLSKWSQLDKTEHFMAVTKTKIFDQNTITSAWDDKTQAGVDLGADEQFPISTAVALHTDSIPLNAGTVDWFHHFLVCPGEGGKIQRWAGNRETDFADLLGGDGYHDSASTFTEHYAHQVGVTQSHVLLINPREADANNELVDNPQRIRYAPAGKLEVWDGAGSGTIDLLDTGDFNIWGANLGKQWIQYQSHSIYSLTNVGGTQIFAPRIEFENLGLLSEHLLHAKNKIHYFVGDDFNVYAYAGGSIRRIIGNNIHRYLQRDIEKSKVRRCWLTMGAENSRLWLYVVPSGADYATFAYGMDIITGSWMKRDLTHRWTTTSVGISAVALIGSGSFTTGKTYAQLLVDRAPSKVVAISGCVRSSNVVTTTTAVPHGFVVSETVVLAGVDSGSEATAFSGSFTIASVPSTTTITHAQTAANESNLAEGTALVDKAPTGTDYINLGLTSRQMLTEVLTDEVVSLGDSEGNVYQFSDTATQDDEVDIPATHITEIYDMGDPGLKKLWPEFRYTAKGTGIIISYRTSDFETTGTGWTAFTEQTLTSNFKKYSVFPNVTAELIQFRLTNADGNDFQLSTYEPIRPRLVGRV